MQKKVSFLTRCSKEPGLGFQTALNLAQAGHTVVYTTRSGHKPNSLSKFYYEPNYKGGGNGEETCVRQDNIG